MGQKPDIVAFSPLYAVTCTCALLFTVLKKKMEKKAYETPC